MNKNYIMLIMLFNIFQVEAAQYNDVVNPSHLPCPDSDQELSRVRKILDDIFGTTPVDQTPVRPTNPHIASLTPSQNTVVPSNPPTRIELINQKRYAYLNSLQQRDLARIAKELDDELIIQRRSAYFDNVHQPCAYFNSVQVRDSADIQREFGLEFLRTPNYLHFPKEKLISHITENIPLTGISITQSIIAALKRYNVDHMNIQNQQLTIIRAIISSYGIPMKELQGWSCRNFTHSLHYWQFDTRLCPKELRSQVRALQQSHEKN